jgi:tetratricopeptide (TPR) repeat protein
MRKQILKGLLIATFSIGLGGCLTQLAVNSTVRIMGQAAPALQSFADPAIAEQSLPYSITQMEGLLLVVPGNTGLRVNLMRALGFYGFGFLEERLEIAERSDDEERVEYYRNRATIAYLRAKDVGFETLTREEDGDGGAQAAVRRGVDAWRSYLQRFDDVEQVPMLFWTGYAWARNINLNKNDPEVLADLPFAIAIFERALELDPSYQNFAPCAAMAAYYARAAPSLGGEPERSRELFERAINSTQRRFLTYLVLEARAYAVMIQDRALYRRLLEEVINAGDVWPEQRLANQIAKGRARRYLEQIDDLFAPEEPAGTSEAPADGATPAPAEGAAPAADAPATTPAPAAATPAPAAATP